jgi:hypothetical protein
MNMRTTGRKEKPARIKKSKKVRNPTSPLPIPDLRCGFIILTDQIFSKPENPCNPS